MPPARCQPPVWNGSVAILIDRFDRAPGNPALLPGAGPSGAIIRADVERRLFAAPASAEPTGLNLEAMRAAIAAAMARSKRNVDLMFSMRPMLAEYESAVHDRSRKALSPGHDQPERRQPSRPPASSHLRSPGYRLDGFPQLRHRAPSSSRCRHRGARLSQGRHA